MEKVRVLKVVYDFLVRRSEEEIDALISGAAKLEIQFTREKPSRSAGVSEEEMRDIFAEIKAFETVEQAQDYFASKSFNKTVLRALAKQGDIPIIGKDRNDKIVQRIISSLVGSKLRYKALLHQGNNDAD